MWLFVTVFWCLALQCIVKISVNEKTDCHIDKRIFSKFPFSPFCRRLIAQMNNVALKLKRKEIIKRCHLSEKQFGPNPVAKRTFLIINTDFLRHCTIMQLVKYHGDQSSEHIKLRHVTLEFYQKPPHIL